MEKKTMEFDGGILLNGPMTWAILRNCTKKDPTTN